MKDTSKYMMSKKYLYVRLVFVACCLLFNTSAFSQTNLNEEITMVVFKDGTIIKGQVVQLNVNTITIWTYDDSIIIRKFEEIERLLKEDHSSSISNNQVDPAPRK